jgi:SAM-dependent methyltransferase
MAMNTLAPLQAGSARGPATGVIGALARSVYLLLETVVNGLMVAEVWPLHAEGGQRLERAGARRVVQVSPTELPLPFEDQSVDVVLCLARFSELTDDDERRVLLEELARVVTPAGFCVVRARCAPEGEGESPHRGGGGLTRAELAALVAPHFARADLVAETPFLGASFFVPGTDEIAVNEDLTRLAASPRHVLLFCTPAAQAPWQLPESLLVPLDGLAELEAASARVMALDAELSRLADAGSRLSDEVARLEASARELGLERDGLRETLMSLQDQGDRREAALSSVRRESERHLKQISDDATALEMLAMERDRAQRRAEEAERKAGEMEVALKRREVELARLERELARLRARPK